MTVDMGKAFARYMATERRVQARTIEDEMARLAERHSRQRAMDEERMARYREQMAITNPKPKLKAPPKTGKTGVLAKIQKVFSLFGIGLT